MSSVHHNAIVYLLPTLTHLNTQEMIEIRQDLQNEDMRREGAKWYLRMAQ